VTQSRLYASAAGAVLVVVGMVGFFYNGHFGSGTDVFGGDTSVKVVGLLAVNGWVNVVHMVTGAIALFGAGYAARGSALGLGALYTVLAVWGFIVGGGEQIASIIPVDAGENVLHLALGVLGLGAGLWRA